MKKRQLTILFATLIALCAGLIGLGVYLRSRPVEEPPVEEYPFTFPRGIVQFSEGEFLGGFSPDGRLLVSAGQNGILRLIEVESSREVLTINAHHRDATAALFSRDGTSIISASGSGKAINLWDASTGAKLGSIDGFITGVHALVLSPDGKTLAAKDGAGRFLLCDLETRKILHPLEVRPQHAVFSPDSKTLVTWSNSGKFVGQSWDVQTGNERLPLRKYHPDTHSLSASPDGKILCCVELGADRQKLVVCDWDTGKARAALSGSPSDVRSVAISPDGKLLALGWGHNVLWDVEAREERGRVFSSGQFTPDGKYLVQPGRDLTFVSVETGEERATLRHAGPRRVPNKTRFDVRDFRQMKDSEVRSLVFSADGNLLISASPNDGIKVWDMRQQGDSACVKHFPAARAISLALHPDGKTLALGYTGHGLPAYLMDLDSAPADRVDDLARGYLRGLFGAGIAVAFSRGGNTLAAVDHHGGLALWDGPFTGLAKGSECQATWEDPRGQKARKRKAVAFHPTKDILVVAGDEIEWFDLKARESSRPCQDSRPASCLAFSRDGKLLATGGDVVQLWDGKTGEFARNLGAGANALAFSPDGKSLACWRGDSIEVWDLATSKVRQKIEGRFHMTMWGGELFPALAFGRGGLVLATSADRNRVALWNVRPEK